MSFQGMSRSIDPMGRTTRRDTAVEPHPALIVSMSLRPGIPWRVALPQSSPPLPRPWTSMQQPLENGNAFLVNGNLSLVSWPHQTTALQQRGRFLFPSPVSETERRRLGHSRSAQTCRELRLIVSPSTAAGHRRSIHERPLPRWARTRTVPETGRGVPSHSSCMAWRRRRSPPSR